MLWKNKFEKEIKLWNSMNSVLKNDWKFPSCCARNQGVRDSNIKIKKMYILICSCAPPAC